MKLNLSIAVVLLLVFNNSQAMTQSEFISRLKSTHPFFAQLNLNAQIKDIDKKATTANQDWVIGVDANYKNEDADNISSVTTYSDLDTTSIDISATKKLIDSGSDITFKHNWKEKDKASTSTLNTNRNKFSIDYVHPLLKNKNGINDRLSTDLASIDIQINNLDLIEQQEGFIKDKLKKFVDLAYAQQQIIINNQRLDLAAQELELVKEKFNASVVDRVDVLLQEDAYQGAKQQQLQAQQDLDLLCNEIAIILNVDISSVSAEIDLYKPYTVINDNLNDYLSSKSRVLQITDLNHNLLKRQLKSDKNESEVELNLNLGIISEGENANYSDSISSQSPTWNVGLGLSYPIGGTKAKSNIEKTQIKITKLKQQRREQLLDIFAQAKVLKQKIGHLSKMLDSNKVQIKIAKARAVEEKSRYENGNSQASFVISAQNNEQNVKLNYAKVAKNYQKSVIDFKAVVDQLL